MVITHKLAWSSFGLRGTWYGDEGEGARAEGTGYSNSVAAIYFYGLGCSLVSYRVIELLGWRAARYSPRP